MTKAQNSFLKAIPDILQELEFNATAEARAELGGLLALVSVETIWGVAIEKVLDSGNNIKIDELFKQLSEQAADNAGTMSKIVGWDATLILLKIYGEKERNYPDTTFSSFNPK